MLRGRQTFWVLALIIGLPFLGTAAMLYLLPVHQGRPHGFSETVHAFRIFLTKDSFRQFEFWLLVIVTILLIVTQILQRFAYIRITNSGMEGYVPKLLALGVLGQSVGHWNILWDSIRSIHLMPPQTQLRQRQNVKNKLAWDLKGYRLAIETDRGIIRLSPFVWTLRDGPDHRLTLGEVKQQKSLDAAKIIYRAPLLKILAPLVKRLRSQGIELVTDPAPSGKAIPQAYDLLKHRGLIVQLVLFFVAGLYALFDTTFLTGQFKVLEPMPLGLFAAVAATGVALTIALGKAAPRRDGAIVGVLLVAALTAAVYPGMLRWNAMTAKPQAINYRAVSTGQFEAMKPGYPRLDLRSLHLDAYWAQYLNGKMHPFVLLRGACGFYQLALAPLYKRTRNFYRKRSAKK